MDPQKVHRLVAVSAKKQLLESTFGGALKSC